LDLIEVYLELGLQDEALKLAQAIVQLQDGRLPLDYYRGLAFYKLNDMSKAKFYFTKQIEQESRRLPSYLMLGFIAYQEEEYEKAEMAFRKAIEEQKWSAEAHYNLAILRERNGRLLEASEHLEKVVEVDPFAIDASVRLVTLYARLANPLKQTERLRKLLGLHPRSAEYAFLRENQSQDLRRLLYAYEDEFLFRDNSPFSFKKKAIVATLREDYGEAIERYQNYLGTLESKRKKKLIIKEILRLEKKLQGKEPLRTSV
jgi:tetratricopeptide (TPR) repeat protein